MMGEEHMLCLDCHELADVSIPKRISRLNKLDISVNNTIISSQKMDAN